MRKQVKPGDVLTIKATNTDTCVNKVKPGGLILVDYFDGEGHFHREELHFSVFKGLEHCTGISTLT